MAKKSSRSNSSAAASRDKTADSTMPSAKKRKRTTEEPPSAPAAPPVRPAAQLSAVAARRLALQKQKQAEEEEERDEALTAAAQGAKSNDKSGKDSTPAIESADKVALKDGTASLERGNAETPADHAEAEEEDGEETSLAQDLMDDDASTVTAATATVEPSNGKRYFRSLDSSRNASEEPAQRGEVDVEVSEGTSFQTGDLSGMVHPSRRRSRRRRRDDGSRRVFLDTTCVSSWQPAHQVNYTDDASGAMTGDITDVKGLLIAMNPEETLLLKGTLRLTVLRGKIDIDGATLSSSTGEVPFFAPSSHPLPVITACASRPLHPESQTFDSMSNEGSSQDHFHSFPVLLRIQDYVSGIEGIEHLARITGIPLSNAGLWSYGEQGSGQPVAGSTFEIITHAAQDLVPTVMPPSWRLALEQTVPSSNLPDAEPYFNQDEDRRRVYLVQGSKGVGKSTFSKALLNRLLSKHNQVAFLESDIGQSEFTPPGMVALHILRTPQIGPSYTHLHQQPLRAHYLGATTPRNNPSRYLACLHDLVSIYSDLALDHPELPLVINTQGWMKGLGGDLLESLVNMARPSVIFNLIDSRAFQEDPILPPTPHMDELSAPAEWINLEPVTNLEYGPPRPNAADLRTLNLLSYLHLRPRSFTEHAANCSPTWDFTTSLAAKRPHVVPFTAFKDISIMTGDDLVYEEILKALDVSIVGLVGGAIEDASAEVDPSRDPETLAFDPARMDEDDLSNSCLGLAIVRSIDTASKSFHILSPLPSSTLGAVTGIQKGEIDIPTVLLTDYADAAKTGPGADNLFGVDWKNVPYLEGRDIAQQGAGIGNARRRIRRNVMRRGQFR